MSNAVCVGVYDSGPATGKYKVRINGSLRAVELGRKDTYIFYPKTGILIGRKSKKSRDFARDARKAVQRYKDQQNSLQMDFFG